MKQVTIGIDLSKHVFEIAIADQRWHIVKRERLSRAQFEQYFVNYPACDVVMEACGSAHYWARRFRAMGHSVKLLPAQCIRAYVRRQKTDAADAAALLEAARCSEILPVPVKTADQQGLQGLHRIRSRWQATRTARINGLRGLLREQGIDLPTGARAGIIRAAVVIEENDLPALLLPTLRTLLAEIDALSRQVDEIDRQLAQVAKSDETVKRVMQVPGIGVLTATALVAAVGSASHFRNGRHLAAWLGITPKQHSSGQRIKMERISKQGDRYLRMLFVHGARSILYGAHRAQAQGKPLSPLQSWAMALNQRTHHNKVCCALANKMARRAWAVWYHHRDYQAHWQTA